MAGGAFHIIGILPPLGPAILSQAARFLWQKWKYEMKAGKYS